MLAPELENLFELASSLSKEEATDGSPASIISDILRLGKDETEQDMPAAGEDGWLAMPFLHDMHADIQAKWDLADFDPKGSCDKPNINLTVMGLILATNIESTVGDHAWSLVEFSLDRLGFDNITHHYFETDHLIDHPAMAFGVSRQTVAGKHVVAAVYRGSSSFEDFISDVKAEPYGFHEAGINACDELGRYLEQQGLSKDDTILFICGHSYGASCASLVGLNAADRLAERDSIFCYSYATPNYDRKGINAEGMKMFSFNSNEDVVPQVPVGPGLDKAGVSVYFDRLDLKLNHSDQYERFLRLYRHFRDADYDLDDNFLPDAYTFKPYVRHRVDTDIIRTHMPYTYMPFLLCGLTDEEAERYVVEVPMTDVGWTMSVGEGMRLPFALTKLISWKVSDAQVATVDEEGLLYALSSGTTLLTASTSTGDTARFKVTVEYEKE